MPLWRIRIRLSDDPHSRALLNEALAGQHVSELNFTPHAEDGAEMAGDVVLELPRDGDLETMLSALHRISPQVFVSRADDSSQAAAPRPLAGNFRNGHEFADRDAESMVAAD